VRINICGLSDPSAGADLLVEVRQLNERADELERTIQGHLTERGGMAAI